MTNAEAREVLKDYDGYFIGHSSDDVNEALDIAIHALEQPPSEDCVSREALRNLKISVPIAPVFTDDNHIKYRDAVFYDDIIDLPSVIPQPKIGYWFIDERPESDRELVCSNCDQPIFKYHKLEFDYRPKYCPNCGANM